MTTEKPVHIYDSNGVARAAGKSDGWGRQAFEMGVVPTEILVNGKRPAVTAATLKALTPLLRKVVRTAP
jgi:hypothetical protein